MLYYIKFSTIFTFRLLWNIIKSPYLSVVSSYRYTKNHCKRPVMGLRACYNKDRIVFIDHRGNASGPNKRRRRGHRGGRKHKHQHH